MAEYEKKIRELVNGFAPAPALLEQNVRALCEVVEDEIERGVEFGIRVATEKEKLVYWIGKTLKDPAQVPRLLEVLRGMGYPSQRIQQVIDFGEPSQTMQ